MLATTAALLQFWLELSNNWPLDDAQGFRSLGLAAHVHNSSYNATWILWTAHRPDYPKPETCTIRRFSGSLVFVTQIQLKNTDKHTHTLVILGTSWWSPSAPSWFLHVFIRFLRPASCKLGSLRHMSSKVLRIPCRARCIHSCSICTRTKSWFSARSHHYMQHVATSTKTLTCT